MPPARYANTPIIQINNTYHHIGGRAEIIMDMRSGKVSGFLSTKDIQKIVALHYLVCKTNNCCAN